MDIRRGILSARFSKKIFNDSEAMLIWFRIKSILPLTNLKSELIIYATRFSAPKSTLIEGYVLN